ncbi:hypothetical protein MRX96_002779 [Rhipicephalus microplus]
MQRDPSGHLESSTNKDHRCCRDQRAKPTDLRPSDENTRSATFSFGLSRSGQKNTGKKTRVRPTFKSTCEKREERFRMRRGSNHYKAVDARQRQRQQLQWRNTLTDMSLAGSRECIICARQRQLRGLSRLPPRPFPTNAAR